MKHRSVAALLTLAACATTEFQPPPCACFNPTVVNGDIAVGVNGITYAETDTGARVEQFRTEGALFFDGTAAPARFTLRLTGGPASVRASWPGTGPFVVGSTAPLQRLDFSQSVAVGDVPGPVTARYVNYELGGAGGTARVTQAVPQAGGVRIRGTARGEVCPVGDGPDRACVTVEVRFAFDADALPEQAAVDLPLVVFG